MPSLGRLARSIFRLSVRGVFECRELRLVHLEFRIIAEYVDVGTDEVVCRCSHSRSKPLFVWELLFLDGMCIDQRTYLSCVQPYSPRIASCAVYTRYGTTVRYGQDQLQLVC